MRPPPPARPKARGPGPSAGLALAAVALIAAGCGGGGGGSERPPPDANPPGIRLDLQPATIHPGGSVEATVHDDTGVRLEGGVNYALERWVGGGWRLENPGQAFIQILVVVEPGRTYSQRVDIPRDARPGTYRVAKDFRAAGRRLRVYGRFRVVSG